MSSVRFTSGQTSDQNLETAFNFGEESDSSQQDLSHTSGLDAVNPTAKLYSVLSGVASSEVKIASSQTLVPQKREETTVSYGGGGPLMFSLLSLVGCADFLGSKWDPIDNDGDGFSIMDGDCYDDNSDEEIELSASINPGAEDVPGDGINQDCDGNFCDGDIETLYLDVDGDSFGDVTAPVKLCHALDSDVDTDGVAVDAWDTDNDGAYDDTLSADAVENSNDCDDSDSAVNPYGIEVCDGIDNNCNGVIDTDADLSLTWYADTDSDGFGNPSVDAVSCEQPSGFVLDNTDCDDDRAMTYPGAAESCNNLDDDCDGEVDEDVTSTFYVDADGDGYGDPLAPVSACGESAGVVNNNLDCDDTTALAFPGNTEECDDLDNDCDGEVDNNSIDVRTWHEDVDGDGYGNEFITIDSCAAVSGFVADATDCDDSNAAVSPGELETCATEYDDDCDGVENEDDAFDAHDEWYDGDGDGYGDDSTIAMQSCETYAPWTTNNDDCDDSNSEINPLADEMCDGDDNNCDGTTDGSDAIDASTWYADTDSDAYGDSAVSAAACTQPSGYVASATDCDDTSAAVNPAASESCNSVDDDCDGTTDESSAVDAVTWYRDADSDGYGTSATTQAACTAPVGYGSDSSDCDDSSASVNPAATELCNSLDDDCDGTTDESDAADAATWYADADSDGYGDAATTSVQCVAPTGYVADDQDCDDTDGSIYPDASEECFDEIDSDCNGPSEVCESTVYGSGTADVKFTGEAVGDGAGYSVALVEDIDGDGLADVVIGSNNADVGAETNAGIAYVSYGASGEVNLSAVDARLLGESTDDHAGFSVGGGDVNGDGLGDVLVGAYGDDTSATDAGVVAVVLGPVSGDFALSGADAYLLGENASDNIGFSLVVGDQEDDGDNEIAFGSNDSDRNGSASGAVYIISGTVSGNVDISTADAILEGDQPGDVAGYSVAMGTDVDGDGIGDTVVGAIGNDLGATDAGAAYLIPGPVSGVLDLSSAASAIWYGSASSESAGRSVSFVGDVDGDGIEDVAVGVYRADDLAVDAGAVTIVPGNSSSAALNSAAFIRLLGVEARERCGYVVAPAGDLDGNGYDDVLTTALLNDAAGTDAGAVYVVYGPLSGTSNLDLGATLLGESAGDNFGNALSSGLDVNGDGVPDFLIGAYLSDGVGLDAGAAYLVYGSTD